MSIALQIKCAELTDKYNSINKALSSINQSNEFSKEATKSRKSLITQKNKLEILIRGVKEQLRAANVAENDVKEQLRPSVMAARSLLYESLKLLKRFKDHGFDQLEAANYANDVTGFLLGTEDDLKVPINKL